MVSLTATLLGHGEDMGREEQGGGRAEWGRAKVEPVLASTTVSYPPSWATWPMEVLKSAAAKCLKRTIKI